MRFFTGSGSNSAKEELFVKRHDEHLLKYRGINWTPENIQRWTDISTGYRSSGRVAFWASSLGSCKRAHIFKYWRVPETREMDAKTQQTFLNGNLLHTSAQVIGLDCGALEHVERAHYSSVWCLSTRIDGENTTEGWLLEYKSARSWSPTRTPYHNHLSQIHAYFLLTGLEKAAYVVHDKSTSVHYEIVVKKDQKIYDGVKRELTSLMQHRDDKTLPPMLAACKRQEGTDFKYCNFAATCHLFKSFEDIEKVIAHK